MASVNQTRPHCLTETATASNMLTGPDPHDMKYLLYGTLLTANDTLALQ